MNRIASAFADQKAFIGFLTGGDPTIQTTEQIIHAMIDAGCDLIEVGIPFSDPIAEGPIIQAADLRALAAHTTTDDIFAMIARIRKTKQTTPIVLMTYLNPVFRYGYEKFFLNCQTCGIDGIIIPDLPYEEQQEVAVIAKSYNIALISMIAPTSHQRIKEIAKHADPDSFLYVVSSMGVTGMRQQIQTDLQSMMKEVRSVTDLPAAIGFGISTPDQAAQMAAIADGAIVGSAIVNIIAEYGEAAVQPVYEYVKAMKQAVSGVTKTVSI